MLELADKELEFIVKDKKIILEPIKKEFFEKEYNNETRYNIDTPDKFWFSYMLCVSKAISIYRGEKVNAYMAGNSVTAFAAHYKGTFVGHYNVYSDYLNLSSQDAYVYKQVLKDIQLKEIA
jgi:hypothetical protein